MWTLPESKEVIKPEGDSDTICNCWTWNNPKEPGKETGWTVDQWKKWDCLDLDTTKISLNT